MRPALELALWLLVSLITIVFCFFFPPPTLNLLSVALTLTEGVRRQGSVPTGPEDSLEGLILLSPKRRDCQYCQNLTQGQDNGAATNPRGLVQDTAPPRSTDIYSTTPTLLECCVHEVTLWSQDSFSTALHLLIPLWSLASISCNRFTNN